MSQSQERKMVHVLLITGRIRGWEQYHVAIQEHVMKPIAPLEKWWVIVSAHGDPNILCHTHTLYPDAFNVRGLIKAYDAQAVNVCKYTLEPPEPHPMYVPKLKCKTSHMNYNAMFYHHWKAFTLLEDLLAHEHKGVTPDDVEWVVKIRADCSPSTPWIAPPSKPTYNLVYCYHSYPEFAAGRFETMKKYCSVYPNRERFYRQHGVIIHDFDEILHRHLEVHGVQWYPLGTTSRKTTPTLPEFVA